MPLAKWPYRSTVQYRCAECSYARSVLSLAPTEFGSVATGKGVSCTMVGGASFGPVLYHGWLCVIWPGAAASTRRTAQHARLTPLPVATELNSVGDSDSTYRA